MKAAVLRAFGTPLAVEDVPDPRPGPGELLLRVRAVSVNRTIDMALAAGRWPAPVALPHVPGIDPAGEVVAAGPGVEGWRPGDRAVAGTARCGRCRGCLSGRLSDCSSARMPGVSRWGGMAELVAVPADAAAPVPDGVSWADASVAMRHGALALQMLRAKAGLVAGETLLVTGAAGALGACLVQVGAALGARVIAVAGGGERAAQALALGAADALDSHADGLAAGLRSLTHGAGVDVATETTGDPAIWAEAFASLGHAGRLVCSAASGPAVAPVELRRLYVHRLQILGAGLGEPGDGRDALALAAGGQLRAMVAARLPLVAVNDAYALADRRGLTGKVLIEPGGSP